MHESTSSAATRYSAANQRDMLLARLRAYGPAFDFELVVECWVTDPDARVSELCAEGYQIETLRVYRPRLDGVKAWCHLYVMRVKDVATGAVIPAPMPLGGGPVLERWQ